MIFLIGFLLWTATLSYAQSTPSNSVVFVVWASDTFKTSSDSALDQAQLEALTLYSQKIFRLKEVIIFPIQSTEVSSSGAYYIKRLEDQLQELDKAGKKISDLLIFSHGKSKLVRVGQDLEHTMVISLGEFNSQKWSPNFLALMSLFKGRVQQDLTLLFHSCNLLTKPLFRSGAGHQNRVLKTLKSVLDYLEVPHATVLGSTRYITLPQNILDFESSAVRGLNQKKETFEKRSKFETFAPLVVYGSLGTWLLSLTPLDWKESLLIVLTAALLKRDEHRALTTDQIQQKAIRTAEKARRLLSRLEFLKILNWGKVLRFQDNQVVESFDLSTDNFLEYSAQRSTQKNSTCFKFFQ